MNGDSVILLIWRDAGITMELPFVSNEGETTPLIEEMAAALAKLAGASPLVEIWRGVAGRRLPNVNDLRVMLTQQCRVTEEVREELRMVQDLFGVGPLKEAS